MTTADTRPVALDFKVPAGVATPVQFVASAALTSVSVYVGGTSTDMDDFTGATLLTGVLSSGDTVASLTLPAVTANQLARTVINGTLATTGKVRPSTRATVSQSITVNVAEVDGVTVALDVNVGAQGPTGDGVPLGGTTGQVLAKASDTDLDTEWTDQTGGGGGGAPTDATYLVTTADAGLSAEVVVGATPGGELGGTWASPTVDATHSGSSHAAVQAAAEATAAADATSKVAAEAALARNADNLTSGTVADARIPSTIARDSEVQGLIDAAINALLDGAPGALDTLNELAAAVNDDATFAASVTTALAGKQPLDADLTAIAALTTTSIGRSLLAAADDAALRTILGLGTAAVAAQADLLARANHTGSQAISTVTGLQSALDGKQATDADLTDLIARWVAASAAGPASLDFLEDTDNGTNRVRIIAPASVGSDKTLTLPDLTGTVARVEDIPAQEITDWTDLGNLGATEAISGVDDTVVRRKGTLDQACTITLTTAANQQIDLLLVQDATGGRAVTFSGVDVWATSTGTAPVTTARTAGEVDRFYFEDIAGTCYGYWLTEEPAASGATADPLRLPIPGGSAPDASGSGNNPATLERIVSSGTQTTNTPKVTYSQLLFDQSTDEHWLWQLRIPQNYSSGGTLRLTWGAKVTSGDVIWKAGIVAADPSTDDMDAAIFNAADAASASTVPGTVGQQKETTITLTMTDVSAGDLVVIFVGRDADAGGDTAAGDATLSGAEITYTAA